MLKAAFVSRFHIGGHLLSLGQRRRPNQMVYDMLVVVYIHVCVEYLVLTYHISHVLQAEYLLIILRKLVLNNER